MGDSFFLSPHISLKLHGGLKGAIIHQKFYVKYKDGNSIENKNIRKRIVTIVDFIRTSIYRLI